MCWQKFQKTKIFGNWAGKFPYNLKNTINVLQNLSKNIKKTELYSDKFPEKTKILQNVLTNFPKNSKIR